MPKKKVTPTRARPEPEAQPSDEVGEACDEINVAKHRFLQEMSVFIAAILVREIYRKTGRCDPFLHDIATEAYGDLKCMYLDAVEAQYDR